jgi:hypothetical protein
MLFMRITFIIMSILACLQLVGAMEKDKEGSSPGRVSPTWLRLESSLNASLGGNAVQHRSISTAALLAIMSGEKPEVEKYRYAEDLEEESSRSRSDSFHFDPDEDMVEFYKQELPNDTPTLSARLLAGNTPGKDDSEEEKVDEAGNDPQQIIGVMGRELQQKTQALEELKLEIANCRSGNAELQGLVTQTCHDNEKVLQKKNKELEELQLNFTEYKVYTEDVDAKFSQMLMEYNEQKEELETMVQSRVDAQYSQQKEELEAMVKQNKELQQIVNDMDNQDNYIIPNEFKCPIMMDRFMTEPVVCHDGHTYEKEAILHWFRDGNDTSPKTGALLTTTQIFPNQTLKTLINDFKQKYKISDDLVDSE